MGYEATLIGSGSNKNEGISMTDTSSSGKLRALLETKGKAAFKVYGPDDLCVRVVSVADLPTRFGDFSVVSFWNNRDNKEHIALVYGDVIDQDDVLVRVHSECLTGDVMGSLRCDCRDQLHASLRQTATEGRGVVLYLRQEGRGIGLTNKIRAYELQDRGLDTVDANLALGFDDDEREYSVGALALAALKVNSIRLLTNNPSKVSALKALGVTVTERVPLVIEPSPENRRYLETKWRKSGHLLESLEPLLSIKDDE
jgi:GTP cyclohydrolase II